MDVSVGRWSCDSCLECSNSAGKLKLSATVLRVTQFFSINTACALRFPDDSSHLLRKGGERTAPLISGNSTIFSYISQLFLQAYATPKNRKRGDETSPPLLKKVLQIISHARCFVPPHIFKNHGQSFLAPLSVVQLWRQLCLAGHFCAVQ